MCKCIKNLEKKMVGNLHKGKKIIKAEYISAALLFEDSFTGIKSTSQLELTVEGLKKPVIQTMVHTYCPFCGEKY
jgi:hypothetical protein